MWSIIYNFNMKKIKLFCLPFAGGLSSIFYSWKNYLNKNIELFPCELAGRGKRFNEPYYQTFDIAIIDLLNVVKKEQIDKNPFMIFGHSLGGLLAFELACKIKELYDIEPIHLFISGTNPPNKREDKILHNLPDKEFIEKILSLGGTPQETFNNKELRNYFLPILRADFKINETYQFISGKDSISCPITILNGEDDIESEILLDWKKYTTHECNFYQFEGDHFFINNQSNISIITDLINRVTNKYDFSKFLN